MPPTSHKAVSVMGVLSASLLVACFGPVPCERAACLADASVRPDSIWDAERTFTIQEGSLVEAELWLSQGDQVYVEFETSHGAIAWDLHAHPGDNEVVFLSGTSGEDSYQFSAPQAGAYWPLWANTGSGPQELTVRIRIDGSGTIASWR